MAPSDVIECTIAITAEVVEADRREEKRWRDSTESDLKKNFEDAMEQVQIQKLREKPLDLARRALSRLEAIPDEHDELATDSLQSVFSEIITRVNLLRKMGQQLQNQKKTREKKRVTKKTFRG